jgi:hypothetical protein
MATGKWVTPGRLVLRRRRGPALVDGRAAVRGRGRYRKHSLIRLHAVGLANAEEKSETLGMDFFVLDFGLPTVELFELVHHCLSTRDRTGPVELAAVDRRGRAITCSLACTPLDGEGGGVVLLMESMNRS